MLFSDRQKQGSEHHPCQAAAEVQLLLLLYPFSSLFSRTTCVSRYQKGKTSLDLNEARDDGAVASA